ncbi:MAG: tryptophan synthase subunit alpha [Deltaproteobacteria bacterium]|nr:tryptophan synthase subunit alpha [Deltaproteobacteria bacterium]
MSRIAKTFAALRDKGEKALILFLTAGDPDLAATERLVLALAEEGADMIELGFPFSDPMADGPTIQASSERALRAGTTLAKVLDLVARLRGRTQIPIVLMGYFNPVFCYGLEKFACDAGRAGVDGVLVVDLPPEEAGGLRSQLGAVGVDFVTLLAPTTPPQRMAALAAGGEGFLYYVSMTGVTGSRGIDALGVAERVRELKCLSPVPVAVGFGVSTPEDVAAVAAFADGVVVGSALVKLIACHGSNPEGEKEVRLLARRLKERTLVAPR